MVSLLFIGIGAFLLYIVSDFYSFIESQRLGIFGFLDSERKTEKIPLGSPYNHVLRTRRLVRLETRYADGLIFF